MPLPQPSHNFSPGASHSASSHPTPTGTGTARYQSYPSRASAVSTLPGQAVSSMQPPQGPVGLRSPASSTPRPLYQQASVAIPNVFLPAHTIALETQLTPEQTEALHIYAAVRSEVSTHVHPTDSTVRLRTKSRIYAGRRRSCQFIPASVTSFEPPLNFEHVKKPWKSAWLLRST